MTEKDTRDTINAAFKLYDELTSMINDNDEEIETLKDEVESMLGKTYKPELGVEHTVEKDDDSYVVTFDFGGNVDEENVNVVAVSSTRAKVEAGDTSITIHLPDDTNAENTEMHVKNGVVTVEFGRDT